MTIAVDHGAKVVSPLTENRAPMFTGVKKSTKLAKCQLVCLVIVKETLFTI